MPQDVPYHSKLIFITYSHYIYDYHNLQKPPEINGYAKHLAMWLYQRLKYAGLPVRAHGVDEAYGGAGFAANSVKASSPMIAVLPASLEKSPVAWDLQTAQENNKEIVFAVFENLELPEQYRGYPLFNFSRSSDEEESFEQLKEILLSREYPAPRYNVPAPDGEEALRTARKLLSEYFANLDSTSNVLPITTEFVEHYYMNVFHDLYNKGAKRQALRDLGNYQLLSGLVVASLQDDPQEDVRAEAALALAKFPDYELSHYLYETSNRRFGISEKASLYTRIASIYRNRPELITTLISDIQEVLLAENNSLKVKSLSQNISSIDVDKINHVAAESLFISYARKDAESYAINFASALEGKGFNVWIDSKLVPGTPAWTEAIENAIRAASIVIVLISPAVHESIWVKREINFAYEYNKIVIPITVLKTEKPLQLSLAQGLRGNPILSENPEEVLNLLVESLQQRQKGIM